MKVASQSHKNCTKDMKSEEEEEKDLDIFYPEYEFFYPDYIHYSKNTLEDYQKLIKVSYIERTHLTTILYK